MATATKPKTAKIVDRAASGKMPSQENLLVNVLSSIQKDIRELRTETKNDIRELKTETKNDIRELRTDIKRLDEKVDSNFKWTLGIMASLIAFVFMVMFFLHNDLKLAVKQNSESINQINQKLDRLLSR